MVTSKSRRPRVLVIEDDRALSRLLQEVLEAAGYVVELAGADRDVLHLGLTRAYDVMVLDRDATATGLDLLRRLRSHEVAAPVLVLSAFRSARGSLDGWAAGADDYLSMPFGLDELLDRLEALLPDLRRTGVPARLVLGAASAAPTVP